MTIRIRNIEYFDWEIPDEAVDKINSDDSYSVQDAIDEFFDPTDISVTEASDPYYEEE